MNDIRAITLAAGGRWHSSYGTAPCPICQPDRRPDQNALTLRDGLAGQLLAHCKKSGCDFVAIAAALGGNLGKIRHPTAEETERRYKEERLIADRKATVADRIWREAIPMIGTLGETYLRRRGITCVLPTTLRFHPTCRHPQSGKGLPAIIARIEGGDHTAIHRTWLAEDGTGKAQVDPPKAMLGAVGGGAVRLVEGQGGLAVAEGIETALSLARGLLKAPVSVWAALSAGGLARLKLPASGGLLIVATDGDVAGRSSGQTLADRASRLGWEVSILPAADGADWNDFVQASNGASQ